MRHLELIADGVIAAVKSHVATVCAPIARRLAELEERIKGWGASPEEQIERMIKAVIATIPPVVAPIVDYALIDRGIAEAVAAAVAALPPAQPGKDATVDIPAVVAEVKAQIPAPPTPEAYYALIKDMIEETVGAAVAALPPAQPGKNADPVDVTAVVTQIKSEVAANDADMWARFADVFTQGLADGAA